MEIVLILENIRSLHNIGSMFRSSDVFGVSKIYLCGYTAAPPRQEISKTALGAETWIPWESRKSAAALADRLRRQGYSIVALEATALAKPVGETRAKGKVALVVGNEIKGVSKALLRRADEILKIPMMGKKESLNVSVAAGIGLFALRSRGL